MRGFVNDIWWMLLLRGIALLLFGIFALVWPGLTLAVLVVLFAVYIFVSGIINIVASIGHIGSRRAWFLSLILGIIEVGAGVFVVKNPGITVAAFIVTIGVIFIIQGAIAIIAAFSDTQDPGARFLEVAVGILGIIAGFVILRYPITGTLTFVWVIGAYGIIAGALNIASALNLRDMLEEFEHVGAASRIGRSARIAKRR